MASPAPPKCRLDNVVAVVHVTPLAQPGAIKLSNLSIDRQTLLSLPQEDIAVAHSLGIPLRIVRLHAPCASIWPARKNVVVRIFDVVVDPTDPRFGEEDAGRYEDEEWSGCMILCRNDVRPFRREQAEALLVYCGDELKELRRFWLDHSDADGEAREAEAQEVARRLLTPEAFAKFFAGYRADQAQEDESWRGVACPVTGSF